MPKPKPDQSSPDSEQKLDPLSSYWNETFFLEADKIFEVFGYSFRIDNLVLPKTDQFVGKFDTLKQQIEASLKLTLLSNKIARQEVIISPILLSVARVFNCPLRIQYSVKSIFGLNETLDYLLQSDHHFLVVGSKYNDLWKGFTKMAAEMITVADVYDLKTVYGAVTIGEAWRFGKLDQSSKTITQDIALYTVPGQLEQLLQILVGILQGDSSND